MYIFRFLLLINKNVPPKCGRDLLLRWRGNLRRLSASLERRLGLEDNFGRLHGSSGVSIQVVVLKDAMAVTIYSTEQI